MSNDAGAHPLTEELILEYWDDLSPEEADWIAGDAHRLMEALQTKFGISEDEAAGQLANFLDVYQTRAQQRG